MASPSTAPAMRVSPRRSTPPATASTPTTFAATGPKARRGRPRPFRRRRGMGQGRRRPLDPEPPDRRRAAGRADRLPRPFAGLVPGARVHRRAFGRAGRRRPFRLERQAAGDCDARAADRARRAPALRQARQKPAHLPDVVRRLQQAVQASAHRLRLAVARREGSRRLCRRSALRLSVHDPARDRRARRAAPRHRPGEPRLRSARTCRSTSSPASAIRSAPTSRA